MARILFGALLLPIGLAATTAAPVPTHLMPKADPICYPTRVGDKLIHKVGESELSQEVLKVEKVESGLNVTMQIVDDSQNTRYVQTTFVSSRGVQLVEYAGRKVDPPLWWLKLPHGEGNKWTGSWPNGSDFAFVTKEWEMVEVPAGKYRAIRVEREESQNGMNLGTTTYWYAPGLGCIKIAGRSPARALTKFTPGKE